MMVVSQEQLESKLNNSDEIFKMHFDDDVTMFILFVKFNANISVVQRVRQTEMQDENTLLDKLQEFRSLFMFISEEDPEYRLVEDL